MVAGDDDGNDGCTEAGNDDCLASDNERARTAERARDDLRQHSTTNHRLEQGGRKMTIPHNTPTMKIWLGGWGNLLLLRQQWEQHGRLTPRFLVYGFCFGVSCGLCGCHPNRIKF